MFATMPALAAEGSAYRCKVLVMVILRAKVVHTAPAPMELAYWIPYVEPLAPLTVRVGTFETTVMLVTSGATGWFVVIVMTLVALTPFQLYIAVMVKGQLLAQVWNALSGVRSVTSRVPYIPIALKSLTWLSMFPLV